MVSKIEIAFYVSLLGLPKRSLGTLFNFALFLPLRIFVSPGSYKPKSGVSRNFVHIGGTKRI